MNFKKFFSLELATENEQKWTFYINLCLLVFFSTITLIVDPTMPEHEGFHKLVVFLGIFSFCLGGLLGSMSYTKGLKILTVAWMNINLFFLGVCVMCIFVFPYVFYEYKTVIILNGITGIIAISALDATYLGVKFFYKKIGIPYKPTT